MWSGCHPRGAAPPFAGSQTAHTWGDPSPASEEHSAILLCLCTHISCFSLLNSYPVKKSVVLRNPKFPSQYHPALGPPLHPHVHWGFVCMSISASFLALPLCPVLRRCCFISPQTQLWPRALVREAHRPPCGSNTTDLPWGLHYHLLPTFFTIQSLNVGIHVGFERSPPFFASVYILIHPHGFKDHPYVMTPEYASSVCSSSLKIRFTYLISCLIPPFRCHKSIMA